MHTLLFCIQKLCLRPKFDITSSHGFVIIIYKFPFINKDIFYYPYIFPLPKIIYIPHLHHSCISYGHHKPMNPQASIQPIFLFIIHFSCV